MILSAHWTAAAISASRYRRGALVVVDQLHSRVYEPGWDVDWEILRGLVERARRVRWQLRAGCIVIVNRIPCVIGALL